MGAEITLTNQLPPDPAQMPSLPGWLQLRIDALANADKDEIRATPQLPASLILNSSEQAEVVARIKALHSYLDLARPISLRGEALTNEQAHGVMIAALLLKGGRKLDQAASDALTEDYLDAIEDLPAWAVREAIRKWNRGESVQLDKKPHDFTWRPEPATLARLSRLELWAVKGRIRALSRLLAAEPLADYSEEYKASMREQLAKVSPSLASLIKAGMA